MYRLTVLYAPPAGPDHFRDYYVSTHLPLAAKLPGLRVMRHSVEVSAFQGESRAAQTRHPLVHGDSLARSCAVRGRDSSLGIK